MTDIVERLRTIASIDAEDAADEIERLRAELANERRVSTELAAAEIAQCKLAEEARNKALEEAAAVCEQEICNCCWQEESLAAVEQCAEAIRQLRKTGA